MPYWNPHAFLEWQPRSSVKNAYRFQAELEAKIANRVSLSNQEQQLLEFAKLITRRYDPNGRKKSEDRARTSGSAH